MLGEKSSIRIAEEAFGSHDVLSVVSLMPLYEISEFLIRVVLIICLFHRGWFV